MKGMKKLAAAAVLTVVALSVVVAGGKTEQSSAKKSTEANKTIRIFGAFRGEEAARFDEIVKAFNAKTGYNVVYEGSPEFETQILVQAEAGTPPDIAALPNPA
ncbi:MAG TPA: extracellular solute-binding protein [Treponemataceae bacterium]|nr:extracellular solute-binding protein [Treponemataceae bacterium]